MKTLASFAAGAISVPASTAWYIDELGQARGMQELFTRQSPERLKKLREHAIVESAISSNRIEGVEIDASRVGSVVFGNTALQDRNEEEIRGYRTALKLIHESDSSLLVDEYTTKKLHKLARGEIWDSGQYKDKDGVIIERQDDGSSRVRFQPVTADDTPDYMASLVRDWQQCVDERWVPMPIAIAAFNLDFLCVHPFRDGNGRVSRLLLLLQCYHAGFEVGRYISLERLIEQNKDRYYETLELSSRDWHSGQHDPWRYINYILSILKEAYRDFEQRVGKTQSPKGSKSLRVLEAARKHEGKFTVSDLQASCPGVSLDTIRRVLNDMKNNGQAECLGKGRNAAWRNTPH